jgi:hypothetical protein
MKSIVFAMLLTLSLFVMMSRAALATELSGRVYSQGSPVANVTIEVRETETRLKTGPTGDYTFQLPPGEYTLVIRGKEYRVSVGSSPTRHDIQL